MAAGKTLVVKKIKHVGRSIVAHWRTKSLVIVLVLAAFVFGLFSANYLNDHEQEKIQNKYNLLSKRVLVDNPNDVLVDFSGLKSEYATYLQDHGLENKVNLYFEYLPTGSYIGVNEDKESLGASLLKLPLVISFYMAVEEGKLSLDTTVSLQKDWLSSSYGDLYKKGEGYQLTYREAIKYALEQSDNTAALTLFDAVSKAQGTSTPNIMGFVDANYATTPTEEILISVESYTSMLKCLYYYCYLNKDDSQAVLNYLAHSADNHRLPLYLPDGVRVAHKIGTFKNQNQSDCGLFYLPKRSYALCVMVQEQDPQASQIIGDLSLMTYQYLAPDTQETQE